MSRRGGTARTAARPGDAAPIVGRECCVGSGRGWCVACGMRYAYAACRQLGTRHPSGPRGPVGEGGWTAGGEGARSRRTGRTALCASNCEMLRLPLHMPRHRHRHAGRRPWGDAADGHRDRAGGPAARCAVRYLGSTSRTKRGHGWRSTEGARTRVPGRASTPPRPASARLGQRNEASRRQEPAPPGGVRCHAIPPSVLHACHLRLQDGGR